MILIQDLKLNVLRLQVFSTVDNDIVKVIHPLETCDKDGRELN